MPELRAFAALRPRPESAASICELPYDVVSTEEARQVAVANPNSFFHVSRPEIDLPAEVDPNSPAVYAQGAASFGRLLASGLLARDCGPCLYLYRQSDTLHTQTGIVGTAGCADYVDGRIRKHELTRPDKEDDRVRHIEALNAQTGPAFLFHRALPALDALVRDRCAAPPTVDFAAPDGVRHAAWVLDRPEDVRWIGDQFCAMDRLYIADGHHRTAAAARVGVRRGGAGGSDRFLAVVFPHDQLRILPYHRVLLDLNAHSEAQLLNRLGRILDPAPQVPFPPTDAGDLALYLGGRWHRWRFRAAAGHAVDPVAALDVARLQVEVLDPVFAIDNPRTSQRIAFVGGVRGTAELERRVDAGAAACAFALAPTRIADLMAIADAGGIMPPKSTWFEPKLRDGLFCHCLA
jgi:uncharacterized protein (DUF1015 family)